MLRSLRLKLLIFLCLIPGVRSLDAVAQQSRHITSDHVVVQMPAERELLGRDLIGELERCYAFMNRATNGSLPRRVTISVDWDLADSQCNYRRNHIVIGLSGTPAEKERDVLFHSIARELARLGLLIVSEGAQREDTEFLFEGMVEILVHEFDHTSRQLEASWTTAKLLDGMNLLGLTQQRSWMSFSGGRRNHRNAAPGITFLKTFRELQGRDRPIRLFESLRKRSLLVALQSAFKASAEELEKTWLQRVREHPHAEEIVVDAAGAPQLVKTEIVPADGPGRTARLRLFFKDADGDLNGDNIFIRDERSGRVLQPKAAVVDGVRLFEAALALDPEGLSERHSFRITAIDESGNLRHWTQSDAVVAKP